jgi:LacI family transcriptional regulator
MDGLIIVSGTTANQQPFIDQVLKLNIPLVLTERPIHRASHVSYVTIDNAQASQNIVSHLINQGYTRIGTITGALDNIDGLDRLTGYKNALNQARVQFDESLVVEGHFTRMSGYLGMKMLLERGVRAVFAASDLMADGATQAILEAGLRVPDDIALVGFDDLPYASQMTPQLTTVRQPIQQKGTYAVNILLDLIEGATDSPQHVLLPTQLVIRESCGAVKTIA